MKKTLILLIILGTTFLNSCATSYKMNEISLGMPRKEVISTLGYPVSTSAIKGVEYLNYKLYETSDDAFFGYGTPYFVRIINGKVDAYGRMGDFDSSKIPAQKIEIELKKTD